jgi:carboxymethylenebutenolidase
MSNGVKTKADGWEFSLQRGSLSVGIVLVHELFGFDEYIETVARDLARKGYWVAAVDLYRGKHASSLEEGFKLRASLSEKDVLDALKSGLQLLRGKTSGEAKIGSMGFCMGGGFALLGACNLDFSFCVDYYGLLQDAEQLTGAIGPIQLILASEDERVTPWAFQHLLPAAVKYKKRIDAHLYPNARHAFHRPNWEGHNPDAAKDAWSKTLLFLSQFK